MLSGIAHVLRVRVIAAERYRIRAAMDDFAMSEKEAARYVGNLDTQLRRWTRFLYGVDWQDPSLYDAVFRVDRVGVEGVADAIVRLTEMGPFKPTEDSRRAFADLLLSSLVWSALTGDARTRSANVRVRRGSADTGDGDRVLSARPAGTCPPCHGRQPLPSTST